MGDVLQHRLGVFGPSVSSGLALGLAVGRVVHLFGLAQAADDVADVVDGDGLVALLLQFVEQLGNAGLYVVGNLFAAFHATEVVAQRFGVLVQQLVGVFVYLVEAAAQIDGNVLFHWGEV